MLNPHKQCQETRRLLGEGALLVDVRTEDEYRQGAIEGAINHPVQWISSGCILEDKETPLVVYCATGMRSRMAKEMLLGAGFNQVYDLGGLQNILAC
ncbi:rhodanese-like domain-containing protein [Gammaproteobacteria bacterium]|nr:rhodanese-like domain-containing protein [Gammaproteobacteria bacterium]